MSNKRNWFGKKKSNKNNAANTALVNEPTSPSKKSSSLNICKSGRGPDNPYYGWKLFFYEEEYKQNSDIVKNVRALEKYIERDQELSSLITFGHLEAGLPFNINIPDLYSNETLSEEWPDFKEDLQDNPLHILNCMKLAIHQSILNDVPDETLESLLDCINDLPPIRIKLLNYQPIVCLRDLKVNSCGKLISTRGCVIRVGRTKQLAQWMVFACLNCGLQKLVKQLQGIYTIPKKCDICGVTKFHALLDSPYTKSVPYEMIRIQELLNDDQDNQGRVPRILDVELVDDLVSTCMPGDDITLTGILKIQGTDEKAAKTNIVNAFSLYMEAVTIINNKSGCKNEQIMDNEMSVKDHFLIKEVYSEENLFALLVHSLCPGIYGHEMIKAGLILSLFGGDARDANLRNDIHVLILGDPGLGKSQMLQACARVAVKGIYICGNSSTSSGLTVTLTKENGSNDFALEPGALVLADRGCCCIDEFDKMSTQHQALLETMEQQSVSVAKSGIICSLPARTSILAAANPVKGRYDRGKTILENINISQPLLSRFDLVFLLLDNPNQQLDSLLCMHVMNFHNGVNDINEVNGYIQDNILSRSEMEKSSLREKLMCTSQDIRTISQSVLRKYISYARQYVKPKLSPNAATVLQKYYLELRSRKEGFGGIPVCNRQLEAMIRLTQARAKLELRTEATEADALDVVEILRYTMTDIVDNDIIPPLLANDGGKLTDKKLRAFIKILKNEVKSDKKKLFTASELKDIAENGGIAIEDFSRFISKLNEQGILLKTGKNYRFVTE